MEPLTAFEPISDLDSAVLILGTMPGVESLRKQQYYGFEHNTFWPIMAKYLKFPLERDYPDRCHNLLRANIALWDVLAQCKRQGSLDSNISEPIPNNFNDFLRNHPNIRTIIFNGGNAEILFRRHNTRKYPAIASDYNLVKLPSTSPANARLNFETKYQIWSIQLTIALTTNTDITT